MRGKEEGAGLGLGLPAGTGVGSSLVSVCEAFPVSLGRGWEG